MQTTITKTWFVKCSRCNGVGYNKDEHWGRACPVCDGCGMEKRSSTVTYDTTKDSVEKINKYTLTDIDKIEYVKKANSYVMFYGAILKTRKWYINSPYEIKEIWDKMPIIFLEKNYYFNIKDGYLELYKKYCFDSE